MFVAFPPLPGLGDGCPSTGTSDNAHKTMQNSFVFMVQPTRMSSLMMTLLLPAAVGVVAGLAGAAVLAAT